MLRKATERPITGFIFGVKDNGQNSIAATEEATMAQGKRKTRQSQKLQTTIALTTDKKIRYAGDRQEFCIRFADESDTDNFGATAPQSE
jgi:hypothetical protein